MGCGGSTATAASICTRTVATGPLKRRARKEVYQLVRGAQADALAAVQQVPTAARVGMVVRAP